MSSLPLSSTLPHDSSFVLSDLKSRLEDNKTLQREFLELSKLEGNRDFQRMIFKPQTPLHVEKNRYSNIFPHSESRVKLNVTPQEEDSDYINANHCNLSYPGKPNFGVICMQGPLDNTIEDTWRMIWENKVKCVIMLTELRDGNREKCAKYWPDFKADSSLFGPIVVTTQSEEKFDSFVIRKIELFNTVEDSSFELTHIHYLSWVDHGAPDQNEKEMLELVSLFEKYYQICNSLQTRENVIVHCSAGIGRTGTFVAIDTVLSQINFLLNNPDMIPEIVSNPKHSENRRSSTVSNYDSEVPIVPQKTANKLSIDTASPLRLNNVVHSPLLLPFDVNTTISPRILDVTSPGSHGILDKIKVDIFDVVKQLRLKRPGMVQTLVCCFTIVLIISGSIYVHTQIFVLLLFKEDFDRIIDIYYDFKLI